MMERQQFMVSNHNYNQYYSKDQHYDKNLSRRSVDWRDSGIVIDEDQQFSSIDSIHDLKNQSGIHSEISKSNLYCPLDKFAYDQDDDGDTILHLAVVGCSIDKVKDLIKLCDVDAINNMMQTPMHVATMANRPDMVELLIDAGAKLNIHDRRGNTPLHLACQKGFEEIARIILDGIKYGRNSDGLSLKQHLELTNFDGQTCLHLATTNDKRNLINMLVHQYEADLNCRDSRSGATILHKAIDAFNIDLVAFILRLEKHCNQADYYGRRPLQTLKILKESALTQIQAERLVMADKLVNDRIKSCIAQNGCCKHEQQVEDILETSSCSDHSDSDSDMC